MNNLKPICFVCNKEVEKMEVYIDHATKNNIFMVFCHGDREICDIPHHLLQYNKIEKGYAFKNKKFMELSNVRMPEMRKTNK